MTYSEIYKARKEGRLLHTLPLDPARKVAWKVFHELDSIGGFADWWYSIGDGESHDEIFECVVDLIQNPDYLKSK